jgi:hypothetical protein
MVSAISNTPPIQPVAQSTATSTPQVSQSVISTDSVTLSKAAQAALAAMQEATESSVQTAQEAGRGDMQAQRLLTREAAAK